MLMIEINSRLQNDFGLIKKIRTVESLEEELINKERQLLKVLEGDTVKFEHFNFTVVINCLLIALESQFKKYRIEVDFLSLSDHILYGNEVLIKEMLLNLFVNAIESLASVVDRPRVIKINLFSNSENNIIFSVTDNGNGVDEEKVGMIFDMNYTTKKMGNGLGMCFISEVVETHSAKMEIKTKEGEFFSVIITFLNS